MMLTDEEVTALTVSAFEDMNARSWRANAELWFEGGSATPLRDAMLSQIEGVIAAEAARAGGALTLGDLGCGDGAFLRRLDGLSFPGRLCGVDLSPQLIALAKRELPRAELHTADLCGDCPLPISELNIATCLLTLIEIARCDRAFELAYQAIVPGGQLVITLLDPTVETLRFLELKRGRSGVRLYDVEGDLAIAAPFEIQGQTSPGPYFRFIRPIDYYIAGLLRAGFAIERATGVRHSGFPFRAEPRGVVIVARKVNAAGERSQ